MFSSIDRVFQIIRVRIVEGFITVHGSVEFSIQRYARDCNYNVYIESLEHTFLMKMSLVLHEILHINILNYIIIVKTRQKVKKSFIYDSNRKLSYYNIYIEV